MYDEDHPIFKGKPQLLKDLQTAKTILNNVKSRRIYRFVREVQTAISEETLKANGEALALIFNAGNIKKDIINRLNRPDLSVQFYISVTDVGYGLK